MEQLIVAARDLSPGDYLPFPGGTDGTVNLFNLSKLERIIAVGVDPLHDLVEVRSQVGGKILIAVALPGSAVVSVFREEEDDEAVD